MAAGTMIGGCLADTRTNVTNATNIGDINIQTVLSSGNGWFVGGCVGKAAAKTYKNFQCYCSLNANGATNAGFLIGTPRTSSIKVTSGAVGGYSLTWDDTEEVYSQKALTENDYFDYIYGGKKDTDWSGTTDHDAVTFLTEAPVIE